MQLEEESSSRAINEQQSCRWSQLTGSKGKVSSFKQLPLCLAFLRIKLGPDSTRLSALIRFKTHRAQEEMTSNQSLCKLPIQTPDYLMLFKF